LLRDLIRRHGETLALHAGAIVAPFRRPVLNLQQLGWNERFAAQFDAIRQPPWVPARIVRRQGETFTVDGDCGELAARLSGRVKHEADGLGDLPALGDWVAVEPQPDARSATIRARLSRATKFSRKLAGGRTEEQVIAANIDTALLVSGLDHDLNLGRIERYLTLVWNSGIDPVIVLNKVDLCGNPGQAVTAVKSVSRGVPVLTISALTGDGVDAVAAMARQGRTLVALGSSGVGKSTLVNTLLGREEQATRAVRVDDSHGRHTTTFGRLIALPGGGVYADTPGLREVQLWGDAHDVDSAFDDVAELAARCRFSDCRHEDEPGCAVRQAIQDGELSAKRYQNYLRLQREMKRLAERQSRREAANSKARWKRIAKQQRQFEKMRRRGRRR
jgi:ribosome biogenesis GTPase